MRHFRSKTALACFMWVAAHASAQISSIEGPVPTTPDSQIFGAADVPGARLSIGLTPFGYVEEEFFITGKASAYRHGTSGPERLKADLPYTTRIVIRRPANPARFSGVVHFEPIHPTGGVTFHWSTLNRYLMSRGDIYVAAALGDADAGHSGSPKYPGQTAPVGQHKVTKWFDPKRYASLSWPEEEGIRYEVMCDIGRKLRSSDADNPLRGLSVRAMLVGGWSYTGSLQRVFINEGFHDRARLPNGKPVFDGYFFGVSSQRNEPGYIPLYNDDPFVPIGDPRRMLKQTDAKVMEFLGELEEGTGHGAQADDRDWRGGGYRLYELAGVIHVASLVDPTVSYREEPNLTQLIQRGYPMRQIPSEPVDVCPVPQSDIPQGAYVRAAVDNLRHWVLEGRAPPPGKRFEWKGTELARDATGNVTGGIRAAEFELPVAQYGLYPGTDKPACRVTKGYPFFVRNSLSRDELVRRYRSAERYIGLYDRETDKLVQQRWLLPEDALRLKARARESVLQQF